MAQGNHPERCGTWSDVVRIVRALYPDLFTRTYVVPPVHFNKVPYERRNVPGVNLSALVISAPSGNHPPKHDPLSTSSPDVPPIPQSLWTHDTQTPVRVQENDFRDDFAQNHVMCNLEALGNSRKEVMFILSRLNFANYLNQPAYAAAAAHLPRPSQLDTAKKTYSNCEADLVLIHRDHGILIGKIKSVGRNIAGNKKETMTKKIRQAAKQLDRAATVVRHILRDEAPALPFSKTVFLPYVSRSHLREVLTGDPLLAKELRTSLGAKNAMEASQLCCCSDDLSDPDTFWDAKGMVLSRMETWWQYRMNPTVGPQLTNEQYIEIVARFVGPATTVQVHCNIPQRLEVRTEGQAVAELGHRFARMILTIQQLDLINRNPPRVYITGPPGTGKTLMLVLQGLKWILQGHPVHIISTHPGSRTISKIIKDQLEETSCARRIAPPTICIHDCDFLQNDEDVTRVVTNVFNSAQDGKVHVIVDEADFNKRKNYGPRAERAVKELIQLLPNACLWVAGIWDQDIPSDLQKEMLTTPLRSAPAVLREVEPAVGFYTNVDNYSDSAVPSPGDGLSPIWLSHHGTAHTGRWPVDCEQCGQDVADMLQYRLRVGGKDGSIKMSDVFILTRSIELQDEVKDEAGNVKSASGFVRGLRAAGLLVDVLGASLRTKDLATWKTETANMRSSSSNKITVAHWTNVQGTERKVVVWLKGRAPYDESQEVAEANDRLQIVSRCTTQLIVVDLPPDSSVTQ